ncbi:transposase [Clostridium sp.]|uniref:IS1/IS1595 family N-terminal zinc-binding domain-containing protein n=1 Tax=Clostridium sp. TaxID=1506 RepID=UPI00262C5985|nr:transposase [Clostridium sp.]
MGRRRCLLKKLELHTNEVLKKNIYKNLNIRCCPICGSEIYIKYGSYKGIQRYKCKKCNKTFSNTTNSLWSYSKKNPKLWIEFLELMIEKNH